MVHPAAGQHGTDAWGDGVDTALEAIPTKVAKSEQIFNATDYGTARTMTTINAAILAASTAGGGTVYASQKDGPWTVTRTIPGDNMGGGIVMLPGISLLFDGTTLILADNCDFITCRGAPTGTPEIITANVAVGDTTVTVADSTGFADGATVWVRLATNPADPGSQEPVRSVFAKVASTTATTITLDTPLDQVMIVADTATVNRRIQTVNLIENVGIYGHVDLVSAPQPGVTIKRALSGINMAFARNITVGKVTGEHVGCGLVIMQFVEDCVVDYLGLRECDGASIYSQGQCVSMSNASNVTIDVIRAAHWQGVAWHLEGACRNIRFGNVHLLNNHPDRDPSWELAGLVDRSELEIGSLTLEGNGGGTITKGDVNCRFVVHNLFLETVTHVQAIDISEVDRLSIAGVALGSLRHVTIPFRILPSANSLILNAPTGIYKSLKIKVSTMVGVVGGIYLGDTPGFCLSTSLVAGVTREVVNPPWYGTVMAGNALTAQALYVFSDATVPAGAYGVLDIDYWPTPDTAGQTSAFPLLDCIPLTARPTGTPAAATDLTTALALVNDLRTKLVGLGLMA